MEKVTEIWMHGGKVYAVNLFGGMIGKIIKVILKGKIKVVTQEELRGITRPNIRVM